MKVVSIFIYTLDSSYRQPIKMIEVQTSTGTVSCGGLVAEASVDKTTGCGFAAT